MADKDEAVTKEQEPKTATVTEKSTEKSTKNGLIVAVLVVFILVAMAGFGMLMAGRFMRSEVKNNVNGNGFDRQMMGRGGFGNDGTSRGGRMRGQNALNGKVTAVNDKKFTIDASGTSYDVQISDTTRFPVSSATSVKVGDTVQVIGTKDSSGVVQAAMILVNAQSQL